MSESKPERSSSMLAGTKFHYSVLFRVVDPVPDSANLVFKLYSSETTQTRYNS